MSVQLWRVIREVETLAVGLSPGVELRIHPQIVVPGSSCSALENVCGTPLTVTFGYGVRIGEPHSEAGCLRRLALATLIVRTVPSSATRPAAPTRTELLVVTLRSSRDNNYWRGP